MRRAGKISAWVLGSLLLIVSLLIGAVYVAGNSASGLGGAFPSHLTLERLELSDARGVWLTADHIALSWSPLDLARRYIRAGSLTVARLSIDRAPLTSNQKSHAIPHIGIGHFSIDVVALGPALVGTAASLVNVTCHGPLRVRRCSMPV